MKRKEKKGNFIFDSVLALLLFAGVSLLLYPTFSNWWNASGSPRRFLTMRER